MLSSSRPLWGLLLGLVLASLSWSGRAQSGADPSGKDPLFAQLSAALDKAHAEQVDVLSPTYFQSAATAYQTALTDAEKGRSGERIHNRLAEGMRAMQSADAAAATARETLRSVISTRSEAVAAKAPELAPEPWAKAADRFSQAMVRLERNDLQEAQKRAAEAEVLLREVELTAIKNGLLNEARGLIAQVDAAKAEKRAPRTVAAARRYLAQADQEISRNRYDTTLPVNLAAQASYEARHALYLSRLIKETEDKGGDQAGWEELILSWEEPLRQIATAVDLQPRFDAGLPPTMQALLAHVQQQGREVLRLTRELQDRNDQIQALNTEMQKLETRLGGVSEERIALQRRVDAQERLRANVAAIENSFTASEARIQRQSDDVVISLLGIRFPSGRATIDAADAPLMNKVRDALARFPGASLVIEGHTDSSGGDSANLLLSQDRADAVRQYLVGNFGVNPEKISSIGYGETRPVARNDTAEGRARNRRIDVIVHVDTSGMDGRR